MKNIIPQVNFAGVNTNLVPVHSRCISFFLCVRHVERYKFTLDYKKLMFMVAWFNDGNYLQRTITLVLNFVCRQRTHVPSLVKKKKKKRKESKEQKEKKKKTDGQPGQR